MNILFSYRLKQRKQAKRIIDNLTSSKLIVIHYSCKSFYEDKSFSPRITSICVLNKETNESIIFSLQSAAEINKIKDFDINEEKLDEAEKHMLKDFLDFAKSHNDYLWLHWNMRSTNFGFTAISNRARVLGCETLIISDNNKIDLQQLFGKLFDFGFEKNKPYGQLLNSANRNCVSTKDAVPGKDEVTLFQNKEYLKLQMSTMRKVEIIDRLLTKYLKGVFKHNSKLKEVYGISISSIYHFVRETPILMILLTFFGFILGIILESKVKILFGIE